MISVPLLRHTWRVQRGRLAIVTAAIALWAFLMPVVYASFGREIEILIGAGIIPEPLLRLLGSDPFSIDGSVALGAVHPIAISLQVVFPVGWAAAAIAGDRERGTLEVLLARPLSRRTVYRTLLAFALLAAAVTTIAVLAATAAAAALWRVAAGLDAGELAALGWNGFALLAALAGISLAASASHDRLAPALGISLGVTLLAYVLEILGTLWPDAEILQPLSPFHYFQPLEILGGRGSAEDLWVLAGILAVTTAYGLLRFPRRDLAAPT